MKADTTSITSDGIPIIPVLPIAKQHTRMLQTEYLRQCLLQEVKRPYRPNQYLGSLFVSKHFQMYQVLLQYHQDQQGHQMIIETTIKRLADIPAIQQREG